jgi:hypothetical protein
MILTIPKVTLFTATSIHLLCLLNFAVSSKSFKSNGYHVDADQSSPQFSLTPANRLQEGASDVTALRENAASETFLDTLLGTNCYSKALIELRRDCRSLEQEEKSRLAVKLTNCQLATQGQETYPCSSAESLRACVERLPDKVNYLYIEFLTHIDSMCLFIQNRNFEKYAETMLNRLSRSADFARQELEIMAQSTRNLAKDTSSIRLTAKDTLEKVQKAHEVQMATAQEAEKHHTDTQHRFEKLSTQQRMALELVKETTQASSKTADMLLSMQHTILAAHSTAVDALVKIKSHTDELVAAHKTAADGQKRLADQIITLLDDSQGLRIALDTLMQYQRRSNAALIALLGNSYSFQDIMFYASSLILVLFLGCSRSLRYAQLTLMIMVTFVWLLERFLYTILHPWLEVGPDGNLMARLRLNQLWLELPWPLQKQALCTTPACSERVTPLLDVSFDVKTALRQTATFTAISMILVNMAYPFTMALSRQNNRQNHSNPSPMMKRSNQRHRPSTDDMEVQQIQLMDATEMLPPSTSAEPAAQMVVQQSIKDLGVLPEVRTPRARQRQRGPTTTQSHPAMDGDVSISKRRSGRSRSRRR